MLVKGLSRRSLLRSWQTADFHNAAQIICNNITYLRDTALNSGQTDHCWKWVETFGVSFVAWGVLETPYPVLSGTLPLPQVAMVKNVHRAQKCAMTGCPQINNPLILKVAKRDLWTYRSQLSNRQGYPETGLPLTAENSAANLFPASGERPYSKISEIAIGGAKMFYQSLLKNVRRGSILYFRHKWRCVWQTLWLESKSDHNSVVFHDANGYAQKWWK